MTTAGVGANGSNFVRETCFLLRCFRNETVSFCAIVGSLKKVIITNM